MTLQVYKYRLYPTKAQTVLLDRSFGSCRYVYNRALVLKIRYYKLTGKSVSFAQLCTQLVKWKKNPKTAWLQEVNAQALQSALRNLDQAYSNFFKKKAKFPRFKSKFDRQSFQNPQGVSVSFGCNRITLPKFQEGVKAKLNRSFAGTVKTVTVSRTVTGKYFASVLVEQPGAYPTPMTPVYDQTVGIDLGLTTYATLSDGTKFQPSRPLRTALKKLRRAQQVLSRRRKGSARRARAKRKVALVHERVTSVRNNFLHQLTHTLVENQDWTAFAVEDLNVQGLTQNRRMALHIGDAGWAEWRRQLEYKAKDRGKSVLVCGRWEPSSKRCPCGEINHELTLADRVWTCAACGLVHDREVLGAQNIRHFAFYPTCTAGQAGIYARGVPTEGRRTVNAQLVSVS